MTSSGALSGLRTFGPGTFKPRIHSITLGARRPICTSCLRTLRTQRRAWDHTLAPATGLSRITLRPAAAGYRGHAQEVQENLFAKRQGRGPLAEYDFRVEAGRLRDDEHQRGMANEL